MKFKDFLHKTKNDPHFVDYADQELIKLFRKTPSKIIYNELKKRGLHKSPLVRNIIGEKLVFGLDGLEDEYEKLTYKKELKKKKKKKRSKK